MKTVESLKATKSAIIQMEKGLVVPQAIDLEEAVLGAVLIDEKNV